MKISQLAKTTGVSARSIRHYEKKNLISAARLGNDYRDFDESVINRIKTIQLYLGLGLTTEQIADIFNCENNNPEMDEYCEEMLENYENKLDEVNRQMNALATVQLRLEKKIHQIKENLAMKSY